MDFDFSEDQKLLKEQARKFLGDKCDLSQVRKVLEGDAPHHGEVWQGLCELGFAGAAVPEAYGGLGLGTLELCVVAEELGRAIAPVPFSSSIYLAAEAIKLYGSEEQKKLWLPRIASGEIIATLAAAEGTSPPHPRSLKTQISGGKLSGVKLPIADGAEATLAVVLTQDSLALVDLTTGGITRKAVKTIDPTRAHAEITFDNASAELLGAQGEGWQNYCALESRAAILFAFEQVGGAEAAMNMAKDYALERYAFGRQIGSYQAIKHKLADMYVRLELARSNCYYAAMALSEDTADLEIAAATARIAATEAYRFAAQENIQTHGGIGFTWEADAQFHYRRAKLLALTLGGPERWKDRLVSQLEKTNIA